MTNSSVGLGADSKSKIDMISTYDVLVLLITERLRHEVAHHNPGSSNKETFESAKHKRHCVLEN